MKFSNKEVYQSKDCFSHHAIHIKTFHTECDVEHMATFALIQVTKEPIISG